MTNNTKIPDDVLQILKQAKIEGNTLTLQGDLDRKSYIKVDKTIKKLGGKWQRKRGCHVFTKNISEILPQILEDGTFCDEKKHFQFFPTPPDLAKLMVKQSNIEYYNNILEPSAGNGGILKFIPPDMKSRTTAIEIDDKHIDTILDLGFINVVKGDFLKIYPKDIRQGTKYDVILMNPPFTKDQGAKHVLHALNEWLDVEGTLIAILPASYHFASRGAQKKLKDFLLNMDHDIVDLPAGTFKKSGTLIRTVKLTVKKRRTYT
jgi:predicted RNA methylase